VSNSQENKSANKIRQPIMKALVFALGWISVVLGVIGIFLPVLPTTPFLLLAAACFVRTSPRFYHWLISHPRLGKYVIYYLDGKGIPLKAKIYTLAIMWTTLLTTAFILVPRTTVQVILPMIGIGTSIYILQLPNLEISGNSDKHKSDIN